MRFIVFLIVFTFFSCSVAKNPIITLRQSSKDNCLVLNRFVFDNPRNNELIFMTELEELQILDSNETKEFELVISEEKYSKILDLDSFRINTVITQGVVVNHKDKGVIIIDTMIVRKPFADTIFIQVDMPKFKLKDGD